MSDLPNTKACNVQLEDEWLTISFNQPEKRNALTEELTTDCLLYTSPSPRDRTRSRMPSSA